ncbi:hypothetical protein NKH18_00005 [Streptomyces sp. M10(2022)]
MHLPAQAIDGDTVRRDIEAAHNGGNRLDLVVTQFHGHSVFSFSRNSARNQK